METVEEKGKGIDYLSESPSLTVEDRQNRLIALASECAEKQMREGTASAQVIVHYLKLGTKQAELECLKLENETKLLEAKRNAIESAESYKDLVEEAIASLKEYDPSE